VKLQLESGTPRRLARLARPADHVRAGAPAVASIVPTRSAGEIVIDEL